MISLRLAVPTILVAAAVAGAFTYFLTPAPPQPVEPDRRLPLAGPKLPGPSDAGMSANIERTSAQDSIDAFQRAAEAILKNAKASAREPVITGPIPLPRKRPIPR